jgi:hypothetical protein
MPISWTRRLQRSTRSGPMGLWTTPGTEAFEEQLGDLRRRRERLLDPAELEDLACDLVSRLRSLDRADAQPEAELASVTAA